MTVTVRSNSSRSVTVSQGSQASAGIVIKKGGELTVQQLTNVVSTDLQDGYSLVYDAATGKFVTRKIELDVVTTVVDGGTY